MRVTIIHNAEAGHSTYGTGDLLYLFRVAGHDVDPFGSEKRDINRALEIDPSVLVVAGGDGTVAKIAIELYERGVPIPLFILPTGTSNNVARSLGIDRPVPLLVQALADAHPTRLDVGVVDAREGRSGRWGRELFIESAGCGFIGRMLRGEGLLRPVARVLRSLLRPRMRRDEALARGVARMIRKQAPMRYRIDAEGEDLSGEYITVEVMNIREIGPRVALAPHALLDDGMLDLLLVRPEDRSLLADCVAAGEAAPLSVGVRRRLRTVEIDWCAPEGHVDDEPWPDAVDSADSRRVQIGVRGFVNVLLPGGSG